MQREQIKDYLKQVLELEKLKYQQEQLGYKVKRKIENINREMNRTVNVPKYEDFFTFRKPIIWIAGMVLMLIIMGIMAAICNLFSIQCKMEYYLYWWIVLSALLISSCIFLFEIDNWGLYAAFLPIAAIIDGIVVYNLRANNVIKTTSGMWFWGISGLCYLCILFCIITCTYENYNVKKRNQRKYNEFTAQREQLRRENKNNEFIRQQLINERNQIYKGLNQTEQILEKLYAYNILYSKYRGLIPVCSIYEYFCSGRCSTLEGHEGAYNIYETELRFARISNQLDEVLDKLDEIADTQRVLHDVVIDANKTTKNLYENMNKIVESNRQIADNVAISNYHLDITRRNTEIIKWMQLFDKIEIGG